MPLSLPTVIDVLPHRAPMVWLDKITAVNCEKRWIKTRKLFTPRDAYFRGHFPKLHIVPGIFLIEGMAQTGLAIYDISVKHLDGRDIPALARVDVRFLKPVFPGDCVIFEARIDRVGNNAAIFSTQAKIGKVMIAMAEMTFAVRKVSTLRSRHTA